MVVWDSEQIVRKIERYRLKTPCSLDDLQKFWVATNAAVVVHPNTYAVVWVEDNDLIVDLEEDK